MATKLEQYTNTLIQLAQIQGVSANNPAIFKLSGASDKVVCVTYEYPSEMGTLLPLNVLFVLVDPSKTALQNNLMYRRVAEKSSTTGLWGFDALPVPDYDDMVTVEQYYDQESLPQPVLLTQNGQIVDKLIPRAGPWDANEVVPKSYIDKGTTVLRNGFFTMYNNMNNRVLYNDERIRKLMSTSTELEAAINNLPANTMSLGAWVQEQETDIWFINHMFGMSNVFIFAWSPEGEVLCYQNITPFDENITQVQFLGSCSGTALVFALDLSKALLGV